MRSPADRQQGLASLELVLCLPIIIVLTMLALAVTQIGHRRLALHASARTGAYVEAYELEPRANGAAGSSAAGTDFLQAMGHDHERFGALRAATVVPTVRTAEHEYLGRRALGLWTLPMTEQHAVVAAPVWEREQLPLGYDQYLRSRLKDAEYDLGLFSGNASDALPEVFPKAK